MKPIIATLIYALVNLNCTAQSKLEVTYNKTTNLIFPAPITSVDRGSQDILVQKAGGVENILRIKAGIENFAETSLSVITTDGKLYSFLVGYTGHPSYLDVDVSKISDAGQLAVIYSEPGTNTTALKVIADSVLKKGANIRAINKESFMVSIALDAIYIHDDVLFLKFALQNESVINFDIDQLHFYLRDKKRPKRTSSQEINLTPILITGDTQKIRAESFQPWIVALPKFTIPDGKVLSIAIMEKNGGRNLFMKVKNRHIMKAQRL